MPRHDRLAVLRQEVAGGAPAATALLARFPVLAARDFPLAMAQFIQLLEEWALVNEQAARRDSVKFWSLKLPAIVAASGSGLVASLHLPQLVPIMIGMLSGVLVAFDGIVRPGALYNIHKRAVHDIRGLEISIVSRWSIASLKNRASDGDAATILADAEKRRVVIASYLKAAEA